MCFKWNIKQDRASNLQGGQRLSKFRLRHLPFNCFQSIAEQQNKVSENQKRRRMKRRMGFISSICSECNPSQSGCCGCQGSKMAIKSPGSITKINYCSTLRYFLRSGQWLNIIRKRYCKVSRTRWNWRGLDHNAKSS